MAIPATQTELNKFVKVVDEFKVKYARLVSEATKSQVYATGNSAFISDYETQVVRGRALNNSINALVGAWAIFKRGYAAVTDKTSMVIGDAIDEIRSWFGYKPAGGIGDLPPGLGATPLAAIPAAVAIAGIVSAALVIIAGMNRVFTTLEANRIQKQNPSISREVALQQAKRGLPSLLPGGITAGMIGLGALALFLILGKK